MRVTTVTTAAVVLALLLAAPVRGHDGPREQIAGLTAQLAREPSRADLYLQRGDLYRVAGDAARARLDLERAAALDASLPGWPLAWARLQVDTHHFAEAVAAASQALAAQPANIAALRLRAQAHVQLHQRAAAVADLTRVIELAPVPDTVLDRARLIAEEPDRLAEALASIEDGIRRLGPAVTLQLEAIDLERRQGRIDAALHRIDAVIAGAARTETWLARKGALLEDARRPAEALRAYHAALEAIDALPARARTTRATLALASDLHGRIDRLNAGTTRPSAGRSLSR